MKVFAADDLIKCGFPIGDKKCNRLSGHQGMCEVTPMRLVPRQLDPIDQPAHYQGSIEAITMIQAALGREGFIAYCKGNCLKYLYRAGKKEGATLLEDLQKAQKYISWAIEESR